MMRKIAIFLLLPLLLFQFSSCANNKEQEIKVKTKTYTLSGSFEYTKLSKPYAVIFAIKTVSDSSISKKFRGLNSLQIMARFLMSQQNANYTFYLNDITVSKSFNSTKVLLSGNYYDIKLIYKSFVSFKRSFDEAYQSVENNRDEQLAYIHMLSSVPSKKVVKLAQLKNFIFLLAELNKPNFVKLSFDDDTYSVKLKVQYTSKAQLQKFAETLNTLCYISKTKVSSSA